MSGPVGDSGAVVEEWNCAGSTTLLSPRDRGTPCQAQPVFPGVAALPNAWLCHLAAPREDDRLLTHTAPQVSPPGLQDPQKAQGDGWQPL